MHLCGALTTANQRRDSQSVSRLCILFFIFGDRQSENKLCANALCTDTVDIFSMSLNDFFYNGKSKTGAALVFSAGEVGFVKSFPDFFRLSLGIPIPVSLTETNTLSFFSVVSIVIVES